MCTDSIYACSEVGTPKYVANKMKSKGLQRLRWYCQICERQMRDENGFKMHTQRESHVRLMQTVGDISEVGRDDFYRVLLTAVPPWPYRRGKKAREALSRIGVSMFDAEVGRLEAFETATEEGVLVRDVDDRRADRGWRYYTTVGEELVSWVSGLRTRDLRSTPDYRGG